MRIPHLTGHLEYEVTMSVLEEQRARARRSFTDEFKRDAVAMVLDDGNPIEWENHYRRPQAGLAA